MFQKINTYQKIGLACILLSGVASYLLHEIPYDFIIGGIGGCGIGLLFWRNKPQKFNKSTNARYKRSLRQN